MTRNIFGWSLPPGVSHHMIEVAYGSQGPCDVCGNLVDSCIRPECPVCTAQGDIRCYDGGYSDGVPHGLRRSPEQIANHLTMERAQAAEQAHWEACAADEAAETNCKATDWTAVTDPKTATVKLAACERMPEESTTKQTGGTREPDDIVGLLSVCRTAITEQWDADYADTIALVERIDNILGPIADAGGELVLGVLDVSTGHLRVAERELLECGELPGQTHTSDFGGMVSTGPFEKGARDDLPDGASATLVAIMREGVRRHCSYVNFDADAVALPGFPTFDDDDNEETA